MKIEMLADPLSKIEMIVMRVACTMLPLYTCNIIILGYRKMIAQFFEICQSNLSNEVRKIALFEFQLGIKKTVNSIQVFNPYHKSLDQLTGNSFIFG